MFISSPVYETPALPELIIAIINNVGRQSLICLIQATASIGRKKGIAKNLAYVLHTDSRHLDPCVCKLFN